MNIEKFLVRKVKTLCLEDHPADFAGDIDGRNNSVNYLKDNVARLTALQNVLYANDKYALFVIFQAMDGAGKDGEIRHVMSGVNPQGTQVFSCRPPSPEELDDDYLWRAAKALRLLLAKHLLEHESNSG